MWGWRGDKLTATGFTRRPRSLSGAISLVVLSVTVLTRSRQCSAWKSDGLSAIGMTTMSGLQGAALSQLKRLLKGKDVVDVSHWSDMLVSHYPDLAPLFEQREFSVADPKNSYAFDCASFPAWTSPNYCPKNLCLLEALKHFYLDIADPRYQPSTSTSASSAPETDPSAEVMQIVNGRAPRIQKGDFPVKLKFSDSDKMNMLIALLGQLHSPSRFGYDFDDLGRETPVRFVDNHDLRNSTVFEYWDSALVAKVIKDRPAFWYSGWTHQNSLGARVVDEEKQAWARARAGGTAAKLALFDQWARESFKLACARVRRAQPTVPIVDRVTKEAELLVPTNAHISAANVFMDFELVKQRILIGGLRTALVLSSILESADAKRLRQGSAVKLKMDPNALPNWVGGEQDRLAGASNGRSAAGSRMGGHASHRSDFSNWGVSFATNLSILSAILLSFAAVVHFSKRGAAAAAAGALGVARPAATSAGLKQKT